MALCRAYDLPMLQVSTRRPGSERRYVQYPTWSWASVPGQVSWHAEHHRPENMLETILISYLGHTPSSDRGHELRLRGVLLPNLPEGSRSYPNNHSVTGTYFPDHKEHKQLIAKERESEVYYCLMVKSSWYEWYLLILRCKDEKNAVYERLGMLRVYFGISGAEARLGVISIRGKYRDLETGNLEGHTPWWEFDEERDWESSLVDFTLV